MSGDLPGLPADAGTGLASSCAVNPTEEDPMSIGWNDDFDEQLNRAAESGKPILLDFSAAPM